MIARLVAFIFVLSLAISAFALSVRAVELETEASSPELGALSCAQAVNCSQCMRDTVGLCGWCGSNDTQGYCVPCTNSSCHRPDTCHYKYFTYNVCPDEASGFFLGLGVMVAIIISSVIGGCCAIALLAACVFFCICRRRSRYEGYVIADHHHHHHHVNV